MNPELDQALRDCASAWRLALQGRAVLADEYVKAITGAHHEHAEVIKAALRFNSEFLDRVQDAVRELIEAPDARD